MMQLLLVDSGLSMQQAALILLVVYVATVLILTPREVLFLRSAVQPAKRLFIIQDILLQVCVLAVLLPTAMQQLTLTLVSIVTGGFALLWIVAVWMAVSRQKYINRILEESRREGEQLVEELSRQIRESQEKEKSGD